MFGRIKQKVSQGVLSVILPDYKTTIQAHMDYYIMITGYSPDIYLNKIQVLQNRAVRIMCNNFD